MLLTGLARIGAARRAIGRGFEVRVAEAAVAAAREHGALATLGEIGKQSNAVFLVDLGTHRHLEQGVSTVGAVAVLAHAGAAILGEEVLLITIVDEGVEAFDRLGDHITALAAVAPVRAAELDELLAPERHAAVAAVAGANIDLGLVEEFHADTRSERGAANPAGKSAMPGARQRLDDPDIDVDIVPWGRVRQAYSVGWRSLNSAFHEQCLGGP